MTIQANFPNVLPSLLLDFANAKKLDPRVTFTRATTATYYDDNTTAMAEQNLVTYSQQFNAWINGNVTLTGSQTAPDGTSTAWLMTDLGNNDDHRIYAFPSASTNTYSIGSAYFKNGTRRYAMLRLQDSSIIAGAVFDLQTGTVASTGGPNYYSSSITSVGGGWYRCVVIGTGFTNGVGNFVLAMSDTATYSANIIYAGSGATLYAWGAQVETRPTPNATAYTPTTTQVITTYIPVLMTAGGGQPRFDHNPTTRESLGLLIEEQRTNIATYSAQFDNGSWGKDGGISVTANQAVAPDGTIAMDLMTRVPGSLNSWAQLTNTVSVGTGGNVGKTYSFSVWVQALPTAGSVNGSLAISDVSYNTYTSSFIATTTPTRVSITTSGGSGWNANGAYIGGGINLDSNNTSVLVWGAQLEVGAFPTSYIPTTNAAATRAGDSTSISGQNFVPWFNNAEGTIYVEASPQTATTQSFAFMSLTNTTGSNNSIAIYYTGGNVVDVENLVNAVAQYTYLIPRGSPPTKVAHGYKANDSNVAVNGTAATTDTVCNIPPVNLMTIGTIYDLVSFPCNGTIRKLAYYPIRVTNAQLAALTS
jgi:hypothetical protein